MNGKTVDETRQYVRGVILAWEKLRVLYTVVLIVEGSVCPGNLWKHLGAPLIVVANVFYCFGPLVETYACVVFGRRISRGRYLLFGAGLVFSMGVIFMFASGRIP